MTLLLLLESVFFVEWMPAFAMMEVATRKWAMLLQVGTDCVVYHKSSNTAEFLSRLALSYDRLMVGIMQACQDPKQAVPPPPSASTPSSHRSAQREAPSPPPRPASPTLSHCHPNTVRNNISRVRKGGRKRRDFKTHRTASS